jgi:hypothetical protein
VKRIFFDYLNDSVRAAIVSHSGIEKIVICPFYSEKKADIDDIVGGRVTAVRRDFVWIDAELDHEGVVKTALFPERVSEGDMLWLQVSRVPWSDLGQVSTHEKGYRLTPHFFVPGQYWIYRPFMAMDDRKWIKRTIQSESPDDQEKIKNEQQLMYETYEFLHSPCTTLGVYKRAFSDWQRILRDVHLRDGVNIIVETTPLLITIRDWLFIERPDIIPFIRVATENEKPLFNHYGIEDVWSTLFHPTAMIPGGGSLDIRELPSLTFIDVNTGSHHADFFPFNLSTLKVLYEHIFLRNLSGNIQIDFLRMNKRDEISLTEHMRQLFNNTDIDVLGFSEQGFFQLVRPRHRPSLMLQSLRICDMCHGDGFVEK